MAWSFIAAETATVASDTDIAVNVPTHSAGDLLVVAQLCDFEAGSPPTADFTGVSGSVGRVWVGWREATGSEPASYTLTSSFSQDQTAVMLAYSGTSGPESGSALNDSPSASTTLTAFAITPAEADSLVIALFSALTESNVPSTPSGTTSRATASASGVGVSLRVVDYSHGASSTGNKTASASSTEWDTAQVAFSPAASSAGPTVGFIPI